MAGAGRWWTLAAVVVLALLLGPALLLTAVRLIEPGFAISLQIQAFTPFGLPLYGAALLLSVVLLVVAGRRGTRRTPVAVVAVTAALGVALHATWLAPLYTGDRPPADGAAITVLSANILEGSGDVEALVREVRAREVDVLVVNEITTSSLAALDAAGLGDLLPHRAGVPDQEEGTRGTMVFGRAPARVVAQPATALDSLVVEVGSLVVLAVHPQPPLDGGTWLDEHALLLDAAREHRPDLVVGDFNATPDHAPMREYGDLGYRDAVELTNGGFQPSWATMRGPGLVGMAGVIGPSAQIDHVLVGQGMTALDASTHDLVGSDHRYVVARVASIRVVR